MKKIFIGLLICFGLLIADGFAQRKKRLAFEGGDLMIYVLAGFPKPLDMNVFGLGTERTDLPPIGGGLQLSLFDYMSVGAEALYTHRTFTYLSVVSVKQTYITALGKVLFHYPFSFFDPYIGGGVGWTFVHHDTTAVEDYGQLYWVGTAGFRLAFGNGSPIGIFAEGSFPYPLIAGGLYFRFSMW